jgi:long-chain fatty acid transport protein
MQRCLATASSVAVASASLCLLTSPAHASGFHIDEQDARATGRAGAVTASPNNASAIYYNPAGIAELHGVQIDVGTSLVGPTASFNAPDGTRTAVEKQVFALPQAYVSGRLSEVVAIGLGVNAPFGLALDWPATSPGSAMVRQAELETFFLTPTLGLNLSGLASGLSLGLGLDLVRGSVRLTRDIPFGTDMGSAALSGTAYAVGMRAGILYRPPALRYWSFGLSYRSPVQLDFTGSADFDAPAAYRQGLPPDGDVATALTLPHTLALGVLFAPFEAWEIEVDANWRGWSSYDRLDIELPDGSVSSSEKAWDDTLTLRVGTEVEIGGLVAARLGVLWDVTPVPRRTLDFQLPDANRVCLTAGLGAALSPHLRVDVGALYLVPSQRSTSSVDPLEPPVKGRFDISAWVIGVSLGFQFGEAPRATPEFSLQVEPRAAPVPSAAGPPASPEDLGPEGHSSLTPDARPRAGPSTPDTRRSACRRGPRVRATQHLSRPCR